MPCPSLRGLLWICRLVSRGDGHVDFARCHQGQSHCGDEASLPGKGRKLSRKPQDIGLGFPERGVAAVLDKDSGICEVVTKNLDESKGDHARLAILVILAGIRELIDRIFLVHCLLRWLRDVAQSNEFFNLH